MKQEAGYIGSVDSFLLKITTEPAINNFVVEIVAHSSAVAVAGYAKFEQAN